jgi:Protein of unknown function (DUF2897)
MSTTIIAIIIVVGLLAGIILGLRSSAKTGMPSKEVLDRATRHAREIDAQEKSGTDADGR